MDIIFEPFGLFKISTRYLERAQDKNTKQKNIIKRNSLSQTQKISNMKPVLLQCYKIWGVYISNVLEQSYNRKSFKHR